MKSIAVILMLGSCLKSRTSLLDTVSTTRGSGWVAHQTCDFANGFELVCLTHPAGGTDCIQAGAKTFEAKPPMLVFAESPSAFAVHDHHQHQEHRYVVSRGNRAAVKRGKARRQVRRREISYVCPMHSDIRSKSPSDCPKCLMKLVAEKPHAKTSRR